MNDNINYNNKMKEIIKQETGIKKLLLHSCCGPCSTSCIERLTPYFDITVIYYNPNIEPREEYEKRKKYQIEYLNKCNHINIVDFMDCDYENELFQERITGLENEPEGGARCSVCFNIRLDYVAKKAKELNYDYFTTTLTVSPHKNSKIINLIGQNLEKNYNIKYLFSDFKKEEGYKKSIEFAKKYELYRQDYCGCKYSIVSNNDKL